MAGAGLANARGRRSCATVEERVESGSAAAARDALRPISRADRASHAGGGEPMSYLAAPQARLFSEQAGTGDPPLVFVHGLAGAHDDWQAQVAYFRRRQRVVACDLPGHGASPGDPARCAIEPYGADVIAVLRALDLPPAVLVGHSMGVRVVLQAYVDAPHRVAGLVLVDGSRLATGEPAAAAQAVRQQMQAIGYRAFMHDFFSGMFLPESDPALKARIVARALALPDAIGTALFPRIAAWDAASAAAALAQVAVPLLVIQSTALNPQRIRVPLEPGDWSPWLALVRQMAPAAQIAIVPNAGHYVMVEQPQVVNRRIAQFVDQLARSS
jgi:pimeloyl-ACP methyl ester carboxylesterase